MTQELESQLLQLSRDKWGWMSRSEMAKLEGLFHPQAVFVHMGATMDRAKELEVIRSGGIHYKQADIEELSVRFPAAGTAIVLGKLTLLAVVGGNEVTNPFVVTEVYVQNPTAWVLASMSFTRLLTPPPAA